MKSLFPSNTALVIVGLFIVALIGSWNFYVRSAKPSPTPIVSTPSPTIVPTETPQVVASPIPTVDIRLKGAISEADTSCFADGVCRIKVGKTWVILQNGGLMPPGTLPPEQGILLAKNGISVAAIGDFIIGKKVEIYGNKIDAETISVYGKNLYYVRLLN